MLSSTLADIRAVIEPPPPRPDPRPEPPPEPIPDPLPEPEPEPPASLSPVRIPAPDASSAAVLMQQAVGRFRGELVEEDERWQVLLHADRPLEQLVPDTIELVQDWLRRLRLPAATIGFEQRQYRVEP